MATDYVVGLSIQLRTPTYWYVPFIISLFVSEFHQLAAYSLDAVAHISIHSSTHEGREAGNRRPQDSGHDSFADFHSLLQSQEELGSVSTRTLTILWQVTNAKQTVLASTGILLTNPSG